MEEKENKNNLKLENQQEQQQIVNWEDLGENIKLKRIKIGINKYSVTCHDGSDKIKDRCYYIRNPSNKQIGVENMHFFEFIESLNIGLKKLSFFIGNKEIIIDEMDNMIIKGNNK